MKNEIQSESEILRQHAEELLSLELTKSGSRLSAIETQKLLHELEVHQIELELQNEELIQAKKQAADIAEKYIELYDFAPSGYFTLSKEGKIIELNLCGSQMLGKERSRLKNSRFGFFVSDDTKPIFNLFLGKVFNSKALESCEVTISANVNLPAYVYLTGMASENREQCMIAMVDITERKQAEQELIVAKDRTQESDRLKSAFLANMSHEIRTPMNGILGFAGLLKEPNLTGEEQQEYISIIEKSGERMLNIINDIIDISKIEAGLMKVNLTKSNINEQIEYIHTFFKPEVEAKGIQLSYRNGSGLRETIIRTDREKLFAILTNLVKNAIKFTNEGSIEFGYKIVETIHGLPLLEFYIRDTGVGIPKNRQIAVFERFIQADISDKNAYQGAGLGLSISKAYVEMLGGEIWVESEVGKGTTFHFTLPYNTEPEEKIVVENIVSTSDADNQVNNLKILIAEDDTASEKLISIMVKKFSKVILKVKTGIEAVEICRNNPDIDLILMDLQMQEMNGYEATRQIRKFNTTAVIIAQTANVLAGDREKAMEAGCNDFIAKPIIKDHLMESMQKYFNKHKS